MSDSYQQDQAGWEWVQEDEQRWLAEFERDVSSSPAVTMTEQMMADFDSIFMNEGE